MLEQAKASLARTNTDLDSSVSNAERVLRRGAEWDTWRERREMDRVREPY